MKHTPGVCVCVRKSVSGRVAVESGDCAPLDKTLKERGVSLYCADYRQEVDKDTVNKSKEPWTQVGNAPRHWFGGRVITPLGGCEIGSQGGPTMGCLGSWVVRWSVGLAIRQSNRQVVKRFTDEVFVRSGSEVINRWGVLVVR